MVNVLNYYYILQLQSMSQSKAEQQPVDETTPQPINFTEIASEMCEVVNDNNTLLEMMKRFFQNDYRLFINFLKSGLDNRDRYGSQIQYGILPKILKINFFTMMIEPSLFGPMFVNIFNTFINKYISMTGQSPAFQCIQMELLGFQIKLGRETTLYHELGPRYVESTIRRIDGSAFSAKKD